MSLPVLAPVEAVDVCHRCDLEPATGYGILCQRCRVIVLALEPDGGAEYTGRLR